MAEKKYVKVPIVMQLETLECGAACLSMILAYHGKWLPLERVRMDCGVSRDGSNAKNIVKAAQNYGLKTKAYKFEPEDLKKKNSFPCIIHWNFNHFVVLCGFKGNDAVINDPASGKVIISEREFDEAFTGICLCFEPDEGFEKSGKVGRETWVFVYEYAKPLRGACNQGGTWYSFAQSVSIGG